MFVIAQQQFRESGAMFTTMKLQIKELETKKYKILKRLKKTLFRIIKNKSYFVWFRTKQLFKFALFIISLI